MAYPHKRITRAGYNVVKYVKPRKALIHYNASTSTTGGSTPSTTDLDITQALATNDLDFNLHYLKLLIRRDQSSPNSAPMRVVVYSPKIPGNTLTSMLYHSSIDPQSFRVFLDKTLVPTQNAELVFHQNLINLRKMLMESNGSQVTRGELRVAIRTANNTNVGYCLSYTSKV